MRRLTTCLVPVLLLALSACASAPSIDGTDASPVGRQVSPTPAPTPSPSSVVMAEIPVVDSSPQASRAAVAPVRVLIDTAGIDMAVVPVGIESGGFMELPVDPAVGGWYRFGPDPWSTEGNTVISAHIDAPEYPIGPFAALRDLTTDTEITVVAADGRIARYAVSSVTYYPKAELPTDELFGRTGARALVLITCGGEFDSSTGHYADNVVAIATPLA